MKSIMLSFLFITYNRSDLLLRTIDSVKKLTNNVPFKFEFVIADDCSDFKHSEIIDSIKDMIVVRPGKNGGIGRNTNNGLSQLQGDFIFQVQDDWVQTSESRALTDAIDFLQNNPDVGILQLTVTKSDTKPMVRTFKGREYVVFQNDRLPWQRACGVRPYSDQPHIKRRAFVRDIGPYLECCHMGICENDYKKRVANQYKWRVAWMSSGFNWTHIGSAQSLNSSSIRHPLVRIIHKVPFGLKLECVLKKIYMHSDHLAAQFMAR